MDRGLTVTDILSKKYATFPFEGAWLDAFDRPERSGVWLIWGNSGNGKTSFVMQLVKELCRWEHVIFDSLEEGTSLTVQRNLARYGMEEVAKKVLFVVEDMETLAERLRKRRSPRVVVIDSLQYTRMQYADYLKLKEEFRDKLFIYISHASGRMPKGNAAVSVMYDATEKVWIEGYKAVSKGRYLGKTGEYVIWAEGAEKYWNK